MGLCIISSIVHASRSFNKLALLLSVMFSVLSSSFISGGLSVISTLQNDIEFNSLDYLADPDIDYFLVLSGIVMAACAVCLLVYSTYRRATYTVAVQDSLLYSNGYYQQPVAFVAAAPAVQYYAVPQPVYSVAQPGYPGQAMPPQQRAHQATQPGPSIYQAPPPLPPSGAPPSKAPPMV